MGKANKSGANLNTPKISLEKKGVGTRKSETLIKQSLENAVIIGGKSPSHPKGY